MIFSIRFGFCCPQIKLDVLSTLRTQDVVTFSEEATPNQGYRALLAVEAIIVPLALLKRNILATTQATDWCCAGGTLLGIKVAKAVETIGKVISRCEPLSRQLLLAAGAQEAVLMPRLLTVGHTSSGDGLLAMDALHGKLLLITRHTEVMVVLRDETLGANWLLASLTGEASLMPAVPFVLHLSGARHDGFLALMTLGGILIGVALSAEQLLILGREGFVH